MGYRMLNRRPLKLLSLSDLNSAIRPLHVKYVQARRYERRGAHNLVVGFFEQLVRERRAALIGTSAKSSGATHQVLT